jgi:hypothetical protein
MDSLHVLVDNILWALKVLTIANVHNLGSNRLLWMADP